MDELFYSVVEDLTIELQNDPDFSVDILEVKVKNAIRDVKLKRNYKATSYNEEQIADDLQNYYSTIVNVARYDYNQIGAEGQSQHNENDVSRTWVDRDRLFSDVIPFIRVLK